MSKLPAFVYETPDPYGHGSRSNGIMIDDKLKEDLLRKEKRLPPIDNPFRRPIDYTSIVRRTFLVEPMSGGAQSIYYSCDKCGMATGLAHEHSDEECMLHKVHES